MNLAILAAAIPAAVLAAAPAERPGERPAAVTAIPGVVAGGARWSLVLASYDTMDGVVGTADGGVLFAQEQTHTIRKLDPEGRESVHMSDTHGGGSISLDAQGRLFVVQRTCTDPGLNLGPACREAPMVGILAPQRRTLASSFKDGRGLGRINDVMPDGKGGAWFTSEGAYHVSAEGEVTVVAEKDLRSNGIMLSPDGRTLYVTNNTEVLAFDVQADGAAGNRRVFGGLMGDTGADGMAVDAAGRLYVTGNLGVHVFAPDGRRLGLMPTPRRPIALAFSGPGKKTLYVVQTGAVGPDGKPWTTPEGVRNNAKSLYTLTMLAEGYAGRPK